MAILSPELLGQLIDAHARPLELFAAQWVGDPADVVQEAFVLLIQQRQQPDNLAAWLYRVVRCRAINAARSARRRRRHEQAAAMQSPFRFEPAAGAMIDTAEASAALWELPASEREIIVMRLWGQLSYEQIADVIGASVSTAYRRYQAGIATLRQKLEEAIPPDDTDIQVYQMRLFLDAVQHGGDVPISGESGRMHVELTRATYKSAFTGTVVKLPLASDDPFYGPEGTKPIAASR